MEKTFKFKTNLKCEGCVAKVKSGLDAAPEIVRWSVDLNNPDRVLTAEMNSEDFPVVQKVLSQAGYKADKI